MTLSLRDGTTLRSAFLRALRPPPQQTVSEWADANRVLPSSSSAEPGPWRTDRVPYLREVMDVLSPSHPAMRVVLMKSARVGGTEAINNAIGCYMAQAPCPIMVVQPSEADAEEWSKDNLDPMLEMTECLRGLVSSDADRRKGNTILHKKYLGGVIFSVGASTPKSFRRRTARVVAQDEVDAYPGSLAGEGDPSTLADNRAITFTWSKKLIRVSTPTVKGASRIESSFLESDQRFYLVPCPECGHYQRLVWSQVHWVDGRVDDAEYTCVECEACIPHHKKAGMLARGRWEATYPERDVIGFHISALYSPWVTWGQLAQEFVNAQGDPTREQVFTNTALGETWDIAGAESWDDDGLLRLVDEYDEIPEWVSVMTAGVDVQDDRLVMQVDGWGPGEEHLTWDYRHILGDPSGQAVWDELDAALLERWAHARGGWMGIKAAAVDNGGHHSLSAGRFCRARRTRRIFAIVGRGGEGKRVWSQKPNTKNKARVELYTVGVDAAKESLHARLRRSTAAAARNEHRGPGYWHFAKREAIGLSYFHELTAEVAIVEYPRTTRGSQRGQARRRWIMRPGRSRNEAWDCSVYSYAVLQGLLAFGAVKLGVPTGLSPGPAAQRKGSEKRAAPSHKERDPKNVRHPSAQDEAPAQVSVQPSRVAPAKAQKRPRYF